MGVAELPSSGLSSLLILYLLVSVKGCLFVLVVAVINNDSVMGSLVKLPAGGSCQAADDCARQDSGEADRGSVAAIRAAEKEAMMC